MVFVIPDMTNDLVTLYVTSWCPFCQRLISALDDAAVPYAAIDVDHDAEAARWVESVNNGNRVVPTVLYSDGTHATNPPAKVVVRKYARLAAAKA